MLTRLFLLFVLLLISNSSIAQDVTLYNSFLIPPELSKDANAVVRWDDNTIEVKAYNKMLFTNKRIVTILNSSGDSKHGAVLYYNKNTNIKKLEVRIYDAMGNEIKKIKKNDFEDVSAVSGGTLYSDDRVKYLNYTPINYPYTLLLESEVEFNSTAFMPGWRPIEGYFISTQNADYKVLNNSEVPIKIKTTHFEAYGIEVINEFQYAARNLIAIKPEAFSPDFNNFAPILKASLTEFEMEGVKGINNDWTDFGKWMNDKLLQDTQVLPEAVKQHVKLLTANATTDLEKAKIVYQYLQDKTRYISVQIGIGGWKPMLAGDVDRLGYGDCKGLSNYTQALLKEVGVDSYYAIIYGDRDIRDIDNSFSSVQGNHAVLCIPNADESDYIWLECTSQTVPFGYSANFTDDRDALIITPEGGKIVHTKVYATEENILNTDAIVNFNESGDFDATVHLKSYGTQYGYHEGVQTKPIKDQQLHYKDYWSHINALSINTMDYTNDKDSIVFHEKVKVTSERYASKAGNRLLIQPNFFNRMESVPARYDKRTLPFEIERGFADSDTYHINLPDNFEVEALMSDVYIANEFGEYSASVIQKENNMLLYSRKFILNKGEYDKEDYEAFREFWLEIIKNDNSKIVLKSKT